MAADQRPLALNERIKAESDYLRGTLAAALEDHLHGGLSENDQQLSKFHGFYQQDDRDHRAERRSKLLDRAHAFMIRVRIPGGVLSPHQWLELDRLASDFGGGSLRLTTRQAVQYHGILKSNLKRVIHHINDHLLDTLAACGDVNRNVICTPVSRHPAIQAHCLALARELSAAFSPRTGAYAEIWLDHQRVEPAGGEEEPLYGRTYLPRKFKIAIAIPPDNDVDVFAHDLGFIAIVDTAGRLRGYTVTVGGGMGMTHGQTTTYPRVADILGFCRHDQALAVAEAVLTTQRDHGDRSDRRHARLKYTVEDLGLAAFRTEVERRAGLTLAKPRRFSFSTRADPVGWHRDHNGTWLLGMFIPSGRITDIPGRPLKTALREIALVHGGEFRLTANQGLIISGIADDKREFIEDLLGHYHLDGHWLVSPVRQAALACVALPTCGLALTEAERALPDLLSDIEQALAEVGLADEPLVVRMTGCPNGCARPYLAEVGLVGKGPGRYNLYLGAAFDGSRLSACHHGAMSRDDIMAILRPLFAAWAKQRESGEHFGDFCVRTGVVTPPTDGAAFHG